LISLGSLNGEELMALNENKMGKRKTTLTPQTDEIDGMDYDDTESELMVVVERLFNDAKVKWKRTNSKGQGYSIAEESIREYFAWGDMPWE
jgi:hypothetical protein